MPEFQTFLTPERMDVFWDNVHWLLFYVAPVIMIWMALVGVHALVKMIRSSFGKNQDEDDEDDYDVYRY